MSPYRIAILGFGTVGGGVLDLLARTREQCEARSGRPLEVVALAVRDPSRPRPLPLGMTPIISGDADALCRDPGSDLVVELIGGVEEPRRWIRTALESGKDVVTANKAVLAEHGEELFDLARSHERLLLFEASVAAAVPILQTLETGLPAATLDSLTGILNGTCNRILAAMEEGESFQAALEDAQDRGFAESDPNLDLSGADAAHKLALLARIITGRRVALDTIRCEGIEAVTPGDLAFGREHGWALKLLAHFRRTLEGAALGVYPTWIAAHSALGAVNGEFNCILLRGEPFGTLLFQGKGAGGPPTAGSVVADILRAARGEGTLPAAGGDLEVSDPYQTEARYYVRFLAPDQPGVLARIASSLGGKDVSIAGVEQPSTRAQGSVPIRMITHRVGCAALDEALVELGDFLEHRPLRIRIEAEQEDR